MADRPLSQRLAAILLGRGMPAPLTPYGGLRNDAGLPPFQMPGSVTQAHLPQMPPAEALLPEPPPPAIPRPGAVPPATLAAPAAATPAAPQMAPPPEMQQPMPPLEDRGDPVKPDVLKAVKQLQAQNLLPEQWKGAFSGFDPRNG